MRKKSVSESAIDDHSYRIFPNDLNSNASVFGGTVMAICDRIASVVAERHSQKICVTLSCDSIRFLQPASAGEILIFKSSLNRSWGSSMEIGVKVIAENYLKGTAKHIVSAYFTFVALDDDCKPTAVPPLDTQTDHEKRRYHEAGQRREIRKKGLN